MRSRLRVFFLEEGSFCWKLVDVVFFFLALLTLYSTSSTVDPLFPPSSIVYG
uniref:Transmembrane protein n=1 Tax=Rhizophora mucronata TaxID=61149 RepID=A0A2P2J7J8_RHIMU